MNLGNYADQPGVSPEQIKWDIIPYSFVCDELEKWIEERRGELLRRLGTDGSNATASHLGGQDDLASLSPVGVFDTMDALAASIVGRYFMVDR